MKPPVVLTIREAWMKASSFLQSEGVDDGDASAEQLLCRLMRWDRSALFLRWSEPFPEPRWAEWQGMLQRRAAGEPVQYITGRQHFYGEEFCVNPSVLIPRPETELLVEAIVQEGERLWPPGGFNARPASGAGRFEAARSQLEATASPGRLADRQSRLETMPVRFGTARARQKREGSRPSFDPAAPHAVDVGTGSGIIAVTLARLCPAWQITATDISSATLQTANGNAVCHDVAERVRFVQGDLLQPLLDAPTAVDIIVSNPPYIETAVIPGLQREVRDHEPRTALDGGADGLQFYRRLVEQMKLLPRLPRLVGFETGAGQTPDVAELLDACSYWQEIRIIRDLAGFDRHVIAIRLEES